MIPFWAERSRIGYMGKMAGIISTEELETIGLTVALATTP